MSFTARTYRVARRRAIQEMLAALDGYTAAAAQADLWASFGVPPARTAAEQRVAFTEYVRAQEVAARIVARGRRERGLWGGRRG